MNRTCRIKAQENTGKHKQGSQSSNPHVGCQPHGSVTTHGSQAHLDHLESQNLIWGVRDVKARRQTGEWIPLMRAFVRTPPDLFQS